MNMYIYIHTSAIYIYIHMYISALYFITSWVHFCYVVAAFFHRKLGLRVPSGNGTGPVVLHPRGYAGGAAPAAAVPVQLGYSNKDVFSLIMQMSIARAQEGTNSKGNIIDIYIGPYSISIEYIT